MSAIAPGRRTRFAAPASRSPSSDHAVHLACLVMPSSSRGLGDTRALGGLLVQPVHAELVRARQALRDGRHRRRRVGERGIRRTRRILRAREEFRARFGFGALVSILPERARPEELGLRARHRELLALLLGQPGGLRRGEDAPGTGAGLPPPTALDAPGVAGEVGGDADDDSTCVSRGRRLDILVIATARGRLKQVVVVHKGAGADGRRPRSRCSTRTTSRAARAAQPWAWLHGGVARFVVRADQRITFTRHGTFRGRSIRCRPRKRHHFATPSLQSDMVDARDAAVGAIVAAAGSRGRPREARFLRLARLRPRVRDEEAGRSSASARSPWTSWASYSWPGGRRDGRGGQARDGRQESRQGGRQDRDAGARGDPPRRTGRAAWYPRRAGPAIWGPIFLGESAFAAMVGNPRSSPPTRGRRCVRHRRALLGGRVRPQALWCAAFRPWARRPGTSGSRGALLAAEAVALGARTAYGVGFRPRGVRPASQRVPVRPPLARDAFGWITAAAVVSANSFAAVAAWPRERASRSRSSPRGWPPRAARHVSAASGDPVPSFVVAWALAAVASDGGRSDAGDVGEEALRSLAGARRRRRRSSDGPVALGVGGEERDQLWRDGFCAR